MGFKPLQEGRFTPLRTPENIFPLQSPPGPQPFYDGVVEPALAMGTGMGASALAGIAGMAQGLNPYSPEGSAANTVRDVQGLLTYQPRSEKGQQVIAGYGPALEPVRNFLDNFRTGDSTLRQTGSPLLATINELGPEIAGSMLPLKGMRQKPLLPKIEVNKAGKVIPIVSEDGLIKSRLINNPKHASTAGYKTQGTGASTTLLKDPVSRAALKQGVSEPVVAMIKSVSAAERGKYRRMVDIVKAKLTNATESRRPSDIAGDSLMDRIRHVQSVNTNARALLDRVSSGLKGKDANVSEGINSFLGKIDELGGQINDKGKLTFDVSSQLYKQKTNITGLNAVMDKINNLGTNPDAFAVHRLKQYIDGFVGYGKKAQDGAISGVPERMLKNLRRSLNESLKGLSAKYDKTNTAYSETIQALDEFQGVAGKKMDLSGVRADSATGTLLRRLLGNAQSRVTLEAAAENMEKIARKYGGKYDDNLASQMKFSNELERIFGAATETSFKAEISQAVDRGIEGLSLRQGALSAGGSLLERARGINQKNAFEALDVLLKEP